MELKQDLAFERQGFDARMRISNTLTTLALEDISIEVLIQEENGAIVPHTSNPNSTALFFAHSNWMSNIENISGSGRIFPQTEAEIRWLIIPMAGASGGGIQGKRYMVGAKLKHTLRGESHELNVTPDFITVKP